MDEQLLARLQTLLLALDLLGTFVFAMSGAMVGIRHRLDLFGVLVLSYAAGTAGGITRDLLIGAVPPASIADWRYIVVPVLAGLASFWWHPVIRRWESAVLCLDAAGLSLFAVSGALKALAFGLNPLAAVPLGMLTGVGGGMARDVLVREVPTVLRAEVYAVAGALKALAFHLNPLAALLLGTLTGIGGGMLRDVLVAEIPIVLRAEVYAVAALVGAAVAVGGELLHLPSTPVAIVGASLCFGLRLGAIRRGWGLPVAPHERQVADAQVKDDRKAGE